MNKRTQHTVIAKKATEYQTLVYGITASHKFKGTIEPYYIMWLLRNLIWLFKNEQLRTMKILRFETSCSTLFVKQIRCDGLLMDICLFAQVPERKWVPVTYGVFGPEKPSAFRFSPFPALYYSILPCKPFCWEKSIPSLLNSFQSRSARLYFAKRAAANPSQAAWCSCTWWHHLEIDGCMNEPMNTNIEG